MTISFGKPPATPLPVLSSEVLNNGKAAIATPGYDIKAALATTQAIAQPTYKPSDIQVAIASQNEGVVVPSGIPNNGGKGRGPRG